MMVQSALGWSEKRAILEKEKRGKDFIKTSEFMKLKVLPGPRNNFGEFDLHRPYVDAIELTCKNCHGKMQRVKEVVDVWFDSGAMPYAQSHWPFEKGQKYLSNKNKPVGIDYPADYISEAVDQTRGWFYTLLAVSTLLGFEPSYKNVVCLGLVLDKYGKKMSKSIGNVVNPWEMIEKYGIDAVRWYLYSATPAGEPKNFDPDEVLKTLRRVHLIVYNSLVFWKTYAGNKSIKRPKKLHILDEWILNILNETILAATKSLNNYDIREAALKIEFLIDNLSRWYIRRSRRRFQKPENKNDFEAGAYTLGLVLNNLAKLMAPFSPFFAEALYNETKKMDKDFKESVHLTFWPKPIFKKTNKNLLAHMELIKNLAAEALKQRAEKEIKVRQPLLAVILNKKYQKLFKNKKELFEILKDESNVKNIVFDFKPKEEVRLDATITPELYKEGILRELIRLIQDLRSKANLKPSQKINLFVNSSAEILKIIAENKKTLSFEVDALKIEFKKSPKLKIETNTKINNQDLWLGIGK
jgi:isoleucyl-tRNA synthetase